MTRNVAVLCVLLGGCAMTRARVTPLGGGGYMVTSSGNGYANRADTEQRAVEEAVKTCAPRRALFGRLASGESEMAMANASAASYVQRPNSVLYFHCAD